MGEVYRLPEYCWGRPEFKRWRTSGLCRAVQRASGQSDKAAAGSIRNPLWLAICLGPFICLDSFG